MLKEITALKVLVGMVTIAAVGGGVAAGIAMSNSDTDTTDNTAIVNSDIDVTGVIDTTTATLTTAKTSSTTNTANTTMVTSITATDTATATGTESAVTTAEITDVVTGETTTIVVTTKASANGVSEKVTEKATEKATEKVTERVTEKATEKATERVTEPVVVTEAPVVIKKEKETNEWGYDISGYTEHDIELFNYACSMGCTETQASFYVYDVNVYGVENVYIGDPSGGNRFAVWRFMGYTEDGGENWETSNCG